MSPPSSSVSFSVSWVVCRQLPCDQLPIRNAPQPFFAGNTDFFYAKILPDGSDLVYGSYFGGSDWDGVDTVAGVALGPNGAFWIAGSCHSRGLATAGAFQTDFAVYPVSILAKFDAANGSLVAATYFDSANTRTMAVDARGEVWVGGTASETLTLRNRMPDHTMVRRIGKGSYGEVWLGRTRPGHLACREDCPAVGLRRRPTL